MLLLAVVGLVMACNDDDTFTTSKSNLLAFSTDTVRLDTTFSKVPTPTKTFWVYNRSGNGIRLANVRLEQGNQTGFRVNVDGIYLGQANGYQVNGLEVRNKDSIRVFVELTTPKNGKADPQLVEDNLVFTLESTVQQKVNLKAYSWDAELLKNIEIKHDTTIQSTKPIVVQGGIKGNSRQDCYASGRPFGLYVRLFAVRPCERTVARHSFQYVELRQRNRICRYSLDL